MAGRGQHTVRVHLHHDHRYCLVADPDDPGASMSLSSLLIGQRSLWGRGLSLTCLLRLAGWLSGRGLSLIAIGCHSHRGTQVDLLVMFREWHSAISKKKHKFHKIYSRTITESNCLQKQLYLMCSVHFESKL